MKKFDSLRELPRVEKKSNIWKKGVHKVDEEFSMNSSAKASHESF